MYKIILKGPDNTIEMQNEANPYEAAKTWAALRAKPLDGQVMELKAAYNNKIFLRHRFHNEP